MQNLQLKNQNIEIVVLGIQIVTNGHISYAQTGFKVVDNGSGRVGKAVASNPKESGVESSQQKILQRNILKVCRKVKNKGKRDLE